MATSKKSVKKVVKKAVKKVAPKKLVAKKAAPKIVKASVKKKVEVTSVKTPFTKSQIVTYLCDATEVKRRDAMALLDAVTHLMHLHLGKKGPGEFNFAGLLKCRVIHKPATKARSGTNPFTGEPTVFAAKPARNVLKIRPLKKLKEIVA